MDSTSASVKATSSLSVQDLCLCLLKSLPFLGKAVLICQNINIFEVGPPCPFVFPYLQARSLWDLQSLHQISALQATVHWMLFLNSPPELC